MPKILKILKSKRKNKKLIAIMSDGKNYHFGAEGSKTFAEGASNEKRLNYIKRHKVLEDFTKVGPASLSRYVLWEKPSIKEGIKEFNQRFQNS